MATKAEPSQRRTRRIPRGVPYQRLAHVVPALPLLSRKGMRRGPRVAAFERACAARFGVAGAVTFPFARVALYALLGALDLPRGGEVVLPPVTITDIVNMILLRGLKPVFADHGERTGNLDPAALEAAVGPRTVAVLATHLNGVPSDMDAVACICRARGLALIEDASQSIGARWRGREIGTLGTAGIVSISTLKAISAFTGGLLLTGDEHLAAEARRYAEALPPPSVATIALPALRELGLRAVLAPRTFDYLTFPAVRFFENLAPGLLDKLQHFSPAREDSAWLGRRETMPDTLLFGFTELQAEVAHAALLRFDAQTRRRRELGERLLARLREAGAKGLPEVPEGAESVWWRFPYWVEDPGALRGWLGARGVDATISGLACCSRDPAFKDLAADTPNAFRFMDRVVFLPIHAEMRDEQLDAVAAATAAWSRERGQVSGKR